MTLAAIWFILVFVLLAGYAILDGFDLGVGALHLFVARNDDERRISINAIGPVWDGNEVWLLTSGGALFAAFPAVYATVFSGFYIALMLLLMALIFRAVSMEFRSKVDSADWRGFWDKMFAIGSILPPVLYGVAMGNVLRGLPIDADGNFTGSFIGLLNPYSIVIGVLTLVLFMMHGTIYLSMKTPGEIHERSRRLIRPLWIATVLLYAIATLYSVREARFLFTDVFKSPIGWVLIGLLLAGLAGVIRYASPNVNAFGRAFIASSAAIGAMMGLTALSLFPRLVPSRTDLSYSLTIHNSSSSQRTLLTMLIIALIGMPPVIGYTAVIYRAFKGKVVIGEESY